MSANVLRSRAGERSKERIDLSAKSCCPIALTPSIVETTFRAYSTSFELSLLCSRQDGTVIRFVRCPEGKNESGGACSLVVAGLVQA